MKSSPSHLLALGALAASVAFGCRDDGGTAIDAPEADAAQDAPIDLGIIEEPEPLYTGSLTIIEAQVLAPPPAAVNTIAAQGIQLAVSFTDPFTAVSPVLDTRPSTLFGCKVTELTAAQVPASAGLNQGSVQFTVTNGGTPADPVFPACVFVAGGTGYVCPDPTSSQALTTTAHVTLEQIDGATSRLTVVAGPATFVADDVGRHVKFSGTGTAFDAAHVAIPIVSLGATANVITIGTGIASPTITLTAGTLDTLAGLGPRAGLADPGMLADGASATAVVTPGGNNNFPSTTIAYGNVGDDFTMDDTNAGRLRDLPRDGSPFSIACATCGASTGTVLSITTTDASVAGQSPFAMPLPTTKRVNIRCAEIGATTLTVPAIVSQYLASASATRIQATFVRGSFGSPSPAHAGLSSVIAGHAMVGFTTIP